MQSRRMSGGVYKFLMSKDVMRKLFCNKDFVYTFDCNLNKSFLYHFRP